MPKKSVAIGIDLGTTKCCVGVVINGKVEILENDHGNKLTPSCVAFTDTERLVGEAAKDQAARNPTNTFSGIKRIMGRTLDDPTLKEIAKNVPYTICKKDGETYLSVTYKKKKELLIPQQVSAMLLNKMKEIAEARLGCSVEKVVISVPSSFTNAQRQATKDAATIAGLKVLALVNESTGAAIAYNANRNEAKEETIAVVDFGGGKLDICIAVVRSGGVEVKAVSGTTEIGGVDIDEVLKHHFDQKFNEKYHSDPPRGPAIMEQVRASCEKLKRTLTFSHVAQDQWYFVHADNVFRALIRKDEFSQIVTSKILPPLTACLSRALTISGIGKCKIDRVVFVGGSSRIPVIRDTLLKFFNSSTPGKSLNPDEAVAQGAAIYAASLSGRDEVKLYVHDKLPNAFFMASMGSDDLELIFDQTKTMIPTTKDIFLRDEAIFKKWKIYEENLCEKDSKLLIGTLCLTEEFAKAAPLVTCITFEINECGIFDVAAQFQSDHVIGDILKEHSYGLSEDKVKNAKQRETQFKNDSLAEEQRIFALADLECKCYKIRNMTKHSELMEHFPDIIDPIKIEVSESIDWLEETEIITTAACHEKMIFLMRYEKILRKKLKEIEKMKMKKYIFQSVPTGHASKILSLNGNPDRMNDDELTVSIKTTEEPPEGLQSNQDFPQKKGDLNSKTSEQLYQIFQQKLESRQQERDHIAVVNNLWEYCLDLRSIMLGFQASEQDQDLVNQLIDESKSVTMWLSCSNIVTKEECEAKKASLAKLLLNIEECNHKRVVKRREEECASAVKDLRACCQNLRSSLLSSEHELESELIIFVSNEVESVLRWLGDQKTASKSKCEKKKLELENLKKTLEETLQEQQ